MMTDVAALVIALLAIRLGQKTADDKRTFATSGSRYWQPRLTPCFCLRSRSMS
jgi:hypothetical protein